jgi:hypothetical protein
LDIYNNLHNKLFLIANMLDYWKPWRLTADGVAASNEIEFLKRGLKELEILIVERQEKLKETAVKLNELFSTESMDKYGVEFTVLNEDQQKALINNLKTLKPEIEEVLGAFDLDKYFADSAELGKFKDKFNEMLSDLEKKSAELRSKTVERNREIYLNTVDTINSLAQTVIDGLRTYWQGYIDFLDKVISGQAEKVSKLRERINEDKQRGDAEQLQLEEERLDKLQKMKEEYVRKQQALATIELISNSMVAIAKAIAGAGGNPALAAVTIALTLAQLAFGLAAARQAAESAAAKDVVGFRKGGYTGDKGYDMYGDKDVAGVVHKGEFVFPEDMTKKYRDFFEALYSGKITPDPRMPMTWFVSNEAFRETMEGLKLPVGSNKETERVREKVRESDYKILQKTIGRESVYSVLDKSKIQHFFEKHEIKGEFAKEVLDALKNATIADMAKWVLKTEKGKRAMTTSDIVENMGKTPVSVLAYKSMEKRFSDIKTKIEAYATRNVFSQKTISDMLSEITLMDLMNRLGVEPKTPEVATMAQKTTLKDVLRERSVFEKVFGGKEISREKISESVLKAMPLSVFANEKSAVSNDSEFAQATERALKASTFYDVVRIEESARKDLEKRYAQRPSFLDKTTETVDALMSKTMLEKMFETLSGKLTNPFFEIAGNDLYIEKIRDSLLDIKPEYKAIVRVESKSDVDVTPLKDAFGEFAGVLRSSIKPTDVYLDGKKISRSMEERKFRERRLKNMI